MSIKHTFLVPHPPIIIKEIGKGQEKVVQKTIDAYHQIAREIAEIKPDTIIISSPHSTVYADYFHISPGNKVIGDLRQFGARDVNFRIDYDAKLRDIIAEELKRLDFPGGTYGEKISRLDHGTLLPLYFINQYYSDFKLIRISPSGMSLIDHYRLGMIINSLIPEDKNVVWVASGDLSHKLKDDGPYGLAQEGLEFDKLFTDAVATGDFYTVLNFKPEFYHKAAECGLGSFVMMTGTLDGYEVKSKLLSYEGTFGVGYGIASYTRLEKNENREFYRLYTQNLTSGIDDIRANEDEYVKLARASLEYFIRNKHKLPLPPNLDEDLMKKRAGTFVSLHMDGRLRGCIGTISPTTSCVAQEIIENAISAGTRDYRFTMVKPDELDKIEYSVDVLSPAEKISSPRELDVKRYGVIVRSGYRSGLLLPNLDGIDTVEEQILIAKRKAGIMDNENYTLERFEVIRHH